MSIIRPYSKSYICIFDHDGQVDSITANGGFYLPSIAEAKKIIDWLQEYIDSGITDDENIRLGDEAKEIWEAKRFSYANQKTISKKKSVDTSCVYLIKDTVRGFVKIGTTVNFDSRFKQIKTSNPSIEFVKKYKGGEDEERALHSIFKKAGKHVGGEWFTLNGSDLAEIDNFFTINCCQQ